MDFNGNVYLEFAIMFYKICSWYIYIYISLSFLQSRFVLHVSGRLVETHTMFLLVIFGLNYIYYVCVYLIFAPYLKWSYSVPSKIVTDHASLTKVTRKNKKKSRAGDTDCSHFRNIDSCSYSQYPFIFYI